MAESRRPKRPPATTPEARENQMISLAVDLAEKQMREGSASAMVITHYLKLATTRSRLEDTKLRHETELLQARKEQIGSSQDAEKMYAKALSAMREYSGNGVVEDDDIYED